MGILNSETWDKGKAGPTGGAQTQENRSREPPPGDFRDFQEILYTKTLFSFHQSDMEKSIDIPSGSPEPSKNPLNKL